MNAAGVGEPGEVTEVIEVKDRTSKTMLILLLIFQPRNNMVTECT